MSEKYLTPTPGGRWGISRIINGERVYLIQNSYLDNPKDSETILRALNIPLTEENLDRYFPKRDCQGRTPTLELLELCNVLDPTNPLGKAHKHKVEIGV